MSTLHHADLVSLVAQGVVGVSENNPNILDAQIQPASIDLRLAAEAYRMPGSVLPQRDEAVRDIIKQWSLEPIDLSLAAIIGARPSLSCSFAGIVALATRACCLREQ